MDQRGRHDRNRAAGEKQGHEGVTPHDAVIGKTSRNPYLDLGCVAAVAKARNAGATQEQILAAITSCLAKGLKGTALGACVAARDGVAATLTERQEHKRKKSR
jgi:hypothetical protein